MFGQLVIAFLVAISAADDPWYDDPQTRPDRQLMVHLFEWKWVDIAQECEKFLQYYGYGAVQVSPPTDHIVLSKDNDLPWWARYQPVSYVLNSRSGTQSEFVNMVARCNNVGVRIVVDVVLNNMVEVGRKKGVGGITSWTGSDFDGTEGVETFPAVPYTRAHFNDPQCGRSVQYGDDPFFIRNCRQVGLLDLDQSNGEVQQKIIDYLNGLINIGVAGFKIDSAAYMWPEQLQMILESLNNLNSYTFGSGQRPFVLNQVEDATPDTVIKSGEYTSIGRYSNYAYGNVVANNFLGYSELSNLLNLSSGYGYGIYESSDTLVFIDNQDTQRREDPKILTYKNGDLYSMAVAFMLAWPYGYPRVMSSYYFDYIEHGPPTYGAGLGWAIKSPTFGPDMLCVSTSGWVCEHRWRTIRGMAKFHETVSGTPVVLIQNEHNRLAFAREGKGYIAFNSEYVTWVLEAQTGLPMGAYCDVWSGELQNYQCTGQIINVVNGTARLIIPPRQVVAFHTSWRI